MKPKQSKKSSATPEMKTAAVSVRTGLRPGDVEAIAAFHARVYSREYGFDHTFEQYVAGPLAEFARSSSARGRAWIAEQDGVIAGCIAIVPVSGSTAQLRWFLVEREARGFGLGKTLLQEAIGFSRDCGYESLFLWTVAGLAAAAHLYQSAGFRKVAEKPGLMWGVEVVEEKYELLFSSPAKESNIP